MRADRMYAELSIYARMLCWLWFIEGELSSYSLKLSFLTDETIDALDELTNAGYVNRKTEIGGVRFTGTVYSIYEGLEARNDSEVVYYANETTLTHEHPRKFLIIGRYHDARHWAQKRGLGINEWSHVNDSHKLHGVDKTTARVVVVDGLVDTSLVQLARDRGLSVKYVKG